MPGDSAHARSEGPADFTFSTGAAHADGMLTPMPSPAGVLLLLGQGGCYHGQCLVPSPLLSQRTMLRDVV